MLGEYQTGGGGDPSLLWDGGKRKARKISLFLHSDEDRLKKEEEEPPNVSRVLFASVFAVCLYYLPSSYGWHCNLYAFSFFACKKLLLLRKGGGKKSWGVNCICGGRGSGGGQKYCLPK